MRYLMFVYGSDEKLKGEEVTTMIGKELQPITIDGTQIKFVYGEENSIFHFDSELKFQEMSIYADLVINEFDDFMYVLIPFDGVMSSNAGDERIKHLLDIGQVAESKNKNKPEKEEITFNEGAIFDMFINIINDSTPFIKFNKNEDVCNMTLDDLLDKILDKGIESLSEVERKKLEEYSK